MRLLHSAWVKGAIAAVLVFLLAAGTVGALSRYKYHWHLLGGFSIAEYSGKGGGAMHLPSGFTVHTVASGLTYPTDFDVFPDGRVVISEKDGLVRLVKDGKLQERPFLDLRREVNNRSFRGIMDVTVDPAFPQEPFVYVIYTSSGAGRRSDKPTVEHVSRFRVQGDVALLDSEKIILGKEETGPCSQLPKGSNCIPADVDHVGADIAFAKDGTMFVSTGDGGGHGGFEPEGFNAQDRNSLAGKILHVDRNGNGLPDNPYWNGNPGANRSKVWAVGMRNPFRITLLPGKRPVLIAADVGADTYEELDWVTRGANLGWPCYEGPSHAKDFLSQPFCRHYYAAGLPHQAPWFFAKHPRLVTIVAGVPLASAVGWPSSYSKDYIFADWGVSKIFTAPLSPSPPARAKLFAVDAGGPVKFVMRPDGNLYYLALNLGELRRIAPPAS